MFRRLSGIVSSGKRAKENWIAFAQSTNGSTNDISLSLKALNAFLESISFDDAIAQFKAELSGSSSTIPAVDSASVALGLVRFVVDAHGGDSSSAAAAGPFAVVSQIEWISLVGRCLKFVKEFNQQCFSVKQLDSGDNAPVVESVLMPFGAFGLFTQLMVITVDLVASSQVPEQIMESLRELLLDLLIVNNQVSFQDGAMTNFEMNCRYIDTLLRISFLVRDSELSGDAADAAVLEAASSIEKYLILGAVGAKDGAGSEGRGPAPFGSSLFLAGKSVQAAFNVVQDILKSAPIASAAWLAGGRLGLIVPTSNGQSDTTVPRGGSATGLTGGVDFAIPADMLALEVERVSSALKAHSLFLGETECGGWDTTKASEPPPRLDVDGDIEAAETSWEQQLFADGNVCEFLLCRGALADDIGLLGVLKSCDSPGLSLKLLRIVQRLLFRRPSTQANFNGLGGYEAIVECVIRTVQKLSSTLSTEPAVAPIQESTLGGYVGSVMETYLLLTLDCGYDTPSAGTGLNLFALEGIKALLLSGVPQTCQLGLGIVKALFLYDRANVVLLEQQGVLMAVCSLLAVVAFRTGRTSPVSLSFLAIESPGSGKGGNLSHLREALATMSHREELLVDSDGMTSDECGPSVQGGETDEEQQQDKEDSVTSSSSRGLGGASKPVPSPVAEPTAIKRRWGGLMRDILFLVQFAAVALSERSAESTMLTFVAALTYVVTSCRMGVLCMGRIGPSKVTRAEVSGRKAGTRDTIGSRGDASSSVVCMNCESELAEIHCLHASCIQENCHYLCQDCDKVFHKAATKRSHIRIPCAGCAGPVDQSILRPIVKLLPESFRNLLYGMQEWYFSAHNRDEASAGCHSDVCETVCVLLASLRGLMDDRRARAQCIPGVLLGIVVQITRICTVFAAATAVAPGGANTTTDSSTGDVKGITSAGTSVYQPGPLATSPSEGNHPENFRDYLRRLADYRDDVCPGGSDCVSEGVGDITTKAIEHLEDPPEDYQHDSLRISISIAVQIIGRFFVSEILTPGACRGTSRFVKGLKYDVQCTRAEMYSRVSFFQKNGGIAMLAHLIVNSGVSVPLCSSDKQAILWTIREITVVGAELDPSLIDGSLQWLVWLLTCPVTVRATPNSLNQSKLNSSTVRKNRQQTPENVSGNIRTPPRDGGIPRPLLTPGFGSGGSGFSIPNAKSSGLGRGSTVGGTSVSGGSVSGDDGPDEQWLAPQVRPHIAQALRLMVLQELRLLVSGEMWESVLMHSRYKETLERGCGDGGEEEPAEEHMFENMIYRIGTCKPSSTKSTRLNGTSVQTSSSATAGVPFAPARVPMSSCTMKAHMVGCGVVRSVYGILFGDNSDSRIRELLNSATKMSGDQTEMPGIAVCELALETWWSAFGFLYLLVLGCDEVKAEIDASIGMEVLAKELLPLIAVPEMPGALSQLLLEMCVGNGSVLPSQQSYYVVSKFPRAKMQTSQAYGLATGEAGVRRTAGTVALGQQFGLLRRANHKVPSGAPALPESYVSNMCDHDNSGGSADPGRSELAVVSGCYYARERALFVMTDCVRPSKLMLQPLAACVDAPVRVEDARRDTSKSQLQSSSAHGGMEEVRGGLGSSVSNVYFSSNLLQTLGRAESNVSGGTGKRGPVRESSFGSLLDSDTLATGPEGRGRTLSSSSSTNSFHSAHALLMLRASLTGHTPTASVVGLGERLASAGGTTSLARVAYVPLFRPLQNTLLDCVAAEFALTVGESLRSRFDELCCDTEELTATEVHGGDGTADDLSPENMIASYLDMFTPHKKVPGQGAGVDTIRATSWYPPFSKLTLRSAEAAELLFTLAVVSIGSELHAGVLSLLSHMIDGNPHNGRMLMSNSRISIAVLGLIVGVMPEKQRGTFSYLLSQLLRYEPNPVCLENLLKFCRTTCGSGSNVGADCAVLLAEFYRSGPVSNETGFGDSDLEQPSARTDHGPSSKVVSTASVGSVCGVTPSQTKELVNQVLYILGRLVERGESPFSYLHFNQSVRVFENPLLLPVCSAAAIDAVESPDEGLSVCTWVRAGTLGDFPVASFMQLSGQAGGGSEFVVDIYFRVVYKPSQVDYEKGSVSSGISTLPGDMIHCEESSKRSLQLCVSLISLANIKRGDEPGDQQSHMQDEPVGALAETGSRTVPSRHYRFASEGGERSGNTTLSDSFIRFSTPQFVIDYDWSEMGDWHLLYLNFCNVEGGHGSKMECRVDGEMKTAMYYWDDSQFGYASESSNQSGAIHGRFSTTSSMSGRPVVPGTAAQHTVQSTVCPFTWPKKAQYHTMDIAVGGVYYEQAYIYTRLQALNRWVGGCKMGVGEHGNEVAALAELRKLQAFSQLVCGFSGTMTEVIVCRGPVDHLLMAAIAERGPRFSLCGRNAIALDRVLSSMSCSVLAAMRARARADVVSAGDGAGRTRAGANVRNSMPRSGSNSSYRPHSPGQGPVAVNNPTVGGEIFGAGRLSPIKHSLDPVTVIGESSAVAPPPFPVVGSAPAASSSIVSDLFTMFASSSANEAGGIGASSSNARSGGAWTRLGLGVTEDGEERCQFLAGVDSFETLTTVDAFDKIGGVRVLYPLLVVDRTRQIAGLRIIAALVASLSRERGTDSAASQNMDNVILFCLHGTPNHLSLESVQVLFELTTAAQGGTEDVAATGAEVDLIRNPILLRLVLNIAVACPKRPQVARGVVEWLKSICEDTTPAFFNARIVLKEVGVLPFIVLLSMWGISQQDLADLENAGSHPSAADKVHAVGSEGPVFSSSDSSRLQSQTSKLLKQMICGTYGDPFNMVVQIPSLSKLSSSSLTTATGFSVAHLSTMLNFVGKATREYSKEAEQVIRRQGDDEDVSMHMPSRAVHLLNAVVSLLEIIVNITEGPLMPVMINMMRMAMPGALAFYMIFDLLACPSLQVRLGGLKLFWFSLYSVDGQQQLDQKQLSLLEKINGFNYLTDLLAQHETDELTVDALVKIMFWRTKPLVFQHGSAGLMTRLENLSSLVTDGQGVLLDEDDEDDEDEDDDEEFSSFPVDEFYDDGDDMGSEWHSPPDSDPDKPLKLYGDDNGDQTPSVADGIASNGPSVDNQNSGTRQSLPLPAGRGLRNIKPRFGNPVAPVDQVESIRLPQLLQVLFRSLHNARSPDVIQIAAKPLEACIRMGLISGAEKSEAGLSCADVNLVLVQGSAGRTAEDDAIRRQLAISKRNFETVCGTKDWLLWIAECIVVLQERLLHSDELNPGSGRAQRAEVLVKYTDCLFGFIKVMFLIDSMEKPNAYYNRGILELTRLPQNIVIAPDHIMSSNSLSTIKTVSVSSSQSLGAHDLGSGAISNNVISLQIMILYDTLDAMDACYAFEYSNVVSSGALSSGRTSGATSSAVAKVNDICLNILKNLSMLLEQFQEKVLDANTFQLLARADTDKAKTVTNGELNMDLYLRILDSIDALLIKTSPAIRHKLKDTALYDMRNLFVTKALLEAADNHHLRTDTLARVKTSFHNLLSSGNNFTENYKYLTDVQALQLLLSWWFELSDCTVALEAGNDSARSQHLKSLRTYIELIQMCVNVSSQANDCWKYLRKFCSDHPSTKPNGDLCFDATTTAILLDGFRSKLKGEEALDSRGAETKGDGSTTDKTGSSDPSSGWWIWGGGSQATVSTPNSTPPSAAIYPATAASPSTSQGRTLCVEPSLPEAHPVGPDSSEISAGTDIESTGEGSVLANEPSVDHSRPNDTGEFVEWLLSGARRTLRDSLRESVNRDVRSVHRVVEKYQERYSQRKAKFLRPLQEKYTKEKLNWAKQTRETSERYHHPTIVKAYSKLEAETAGTVASLVERINLGNDEFVQCITTLSASPSGESDAFKVPRRLFQAPGAEIVSETTGSATAVNNRTRGLEITTGTAFAHHSSVGSMVDELSHYFAYG